MHVVQTPEENSMAVVKDVHDIVAKGVEIPQQFIREELAAAGPYAPNSIMYSFKGRSP